MPSDSPGPKGTRRMGRTLANPETQMTIPWHLLYLGIAVGGLVVLALKWLHILPVAELSSLYLALILSGIFLGVSLLYWWNRTRRPPERADCAR